MTNFKEMLFNVFLYKEKENYNFMLPETESEHAAASNEPIDKEKNNDVTININKNIYSSLDKNLEYMKVIYNSLISSDIQIREFTLIAKNKEYKAFLLYIDGMVDSKLINSYVLNALMIRNNSNTYSEKDKDAKNSIIATKKSSKTDLEDYIIESLLPQNSVTTVETFENLVSDVNSGNCALFIDTASLAFSIESKGFQQRSVSEPSNEVVVKGPREAFVENLRTNTALLRRCLNSEHLVVENISIGKVTRTNAAICYLKDVANNDLISEVRFRLNNLDIDALLSSGQLEQLIQDHSNVIFPQIMSTERPDKAANNILEGRVIIIVNGSPYALITPAVFTDFLSSPEDKNLKYQYSNLLKIIRVFALFFALLLPGIYVGITNYHQELIPTELLFAMVSAKTSVPFPVIFEILIMEISFELLREAGVRVPGPLGPTIGIVGALVLGQAAVSANIVSPILIIVVAITGICTFAIPDFSLSFSVRVFRFLFILLGYMAGFLGLAFGIFVIIAILASVKSFGVSYLSPYLPVSDISHNSNYFVSAPWKQEQRPDFLNTKKSNIQKHISMKWRNFKEKH